MMMIKLLHKAFKNSSLKQLNSVIKCFVVLKWKRYFEYFLTPLYYLLNHLSEKKKKEEKKKDHVKIRFSSSGKERGAEKLKKKNENQVPKKNEFN